MSNNDELLLFIRSKNIAGLKGNIYIYRFEDKIETKIFENNDIIDIINPTFSKDNNKIIFSYEYEYENYDEIYRYDFKIVNFDWENMKLNTLLENRRFLVPVSLPKTEKILYFGSNESVKEFKAVTKNSSKEKEKLGFFLFDNNNNKFLHDVYLMRYYLNISKNGNDILFIINDDICEFNIKENSITKLEIKKGKIYNELFLSKRK